MKENTLIMIFIISAILIFAIVLISTIAIDSSKEVKISCIKNNQTYISLSYKDLPIKLEYCGSDINELVSNIMEKTK